MAETGIAAVQRNRLRRVPGGRPRQVIVRLTIDEHVALQQRAADANVSVQRYLLEAGLSGVAGDGAARRRAERELVSTRGVLRAAREQSQPVDQVGQHQWRAAVSSSSRFWPKWPSATSALIRASGAARCHTRDGPVIAKISKGASGRGLIRYLFGAGKANEHSDQRVIASGVSLWAEEGRMLSAREIADLGASLDAANDTYGRNPAGGHIWHVSLSVADGERLMTDEQWAEMAQTVMRTMGFEKEGVVPAAWVAIGHGAERPG